MEFIRRLKLFQKMATAIFLFFMGLMLLVSIVAFTRRSGHTGLDMAKVQKMRYESANKPAKDTSTLNH